MHKNCFLKIHYTIFFIITLLTGCSQECIDPGESYDVSRGGVKILPINPNVLDYSTATGLKDKTTEQLARSNLWFKAQTKNSNSKSDLIVYEGLEVKMTVEGQINTKGFFYNLHIPVIKIIKKGVASKTPEMNFIPPVSMPRTMRKGDIVNIDVYAYEGQYPMIKKFSDGKEYYVKLNNGYGLVVDHIPTGIDYVGLSQEKAAVLKNMNSGFDLEGKIPPTNPEDWQCSFGVYKTNNEWRSDYFFQLVGTSGEYFPREYTGVTDYFDTTSSTSDSLCEPQKNNCQLDIKCSNPDLNMLIFKDESISTTNGDMMCYGIKRTGIYAGFDAYDVVKKNATWTFISSDKNTPENVIAAPANVGVFETKVIRDYKYANFSELARHENFARCTPNWKNAGWMNLNDEQYFSEGDTFMSGFYRVDFPTAPSSEICEKVISKFKIRQAASRVGGLIKFSYMNDGESKNLTRDNQKRKLTGFYDRFVKKELKNNQGWCFSDDNTRQGDCNVEKPDPSKLDEQEKSHLMCGLYRIHRGYKGGADIDDGMDNWYGFPDNGDNSARDIYNEICDSQYDIQACDSPSFSTIYDTQIFLHRFIGNDLPYDASGGGFPCVVEMKISDSATKSGVSTFEASETGDFPSSLPADWGFIGIVPKGYDVKFQTKQRSGQLSSKMHFAKFFLGDDTPVSTLTYGKECGLANVFRTVPLPKKVCLNGYINSCNNPFVNYKVEKEGLGNVLTNNTLTSQYCLESNDGNKLGLCIKVVKKKDGTTLSYLLEDLNTPVNTAKERAFTTPDSVSWSPAFNVNATRCGLCTAKGALEKKGSVVKMQADERSLGLAKTSGKQILNQSQCERDKDLEWVHEYVNSQEDSVSYTFLPNVPVAKCLDDPLVETSVTGSLSFNGPTSTLKMLSLTDSLKTVKVSQDPSRPTHLYLKSTHTVPHDSEMLFYIAGDLSDQVKDNASTLLTQHVSFKDKTGGFSLNVYNAKPLEDGEGMYIYIQGIDPATKQPDPLQHPDVFFKDKDFFFIRDNSESFKNLQVGDKIVRYVPKKTGVVWFIVPDFTPCVNNSCIADSRYDGQYIQFNVNTKSNETLEVNNISNNVEDFNNGYYEVSLTAKQAKSSAVVGLNVVSYFLVNPVKDFFLGPIVNNERQWNQGFTYTVATNFINNAFFQMIFYMGLLLTIFMHGFNIITGNGKPPMDVKSVMKEISKFAFIVAFISPGSFTLYQEYFIKGLIRLSEGFGGLVSNSLGATVPTVHSVTSDVMNFEFNLEIKDENVDGGIFSTIGNVYSYFFEEKTLIRLSALITYNFPVGLVMLVLIMGGLALFFMNSFKAVLMYLGSVIGICIYGAVGPIFILAKINDNTSKAFDTWWKDLLGLVIQQGMFLIGIGIFSTIFMETARGLLRFGVCLEPVLTIPVINFSLLSLYTVQGTVPSYVKNFMPEYKSYSFDDANIITVLALLMTAVCLMKFMESMEKMSQGKAMDFVPNFLSNLPSKAAGLAASVFQGKGKK